MNTTEKNFVCEVTDSHESIIQQVSKAMVEDDRAMDLADLFKMFSDSTRLKILYALSIHEMCVCDLAELLNMGQSAIFPPASAAAYFQARQNTQGKERLFFIRWMTAMWRISSGLAMNISWRRNRIMNKYRFLLQGLTCSHCAMKIEEKMGSYPFVESSVVKFYGTGADHYLKERNPKRGNSCRLSRRRWTKLKMASRWCRRKMSIVPPKIRLPARNHSSAGRPDLLALRHEN